MIIRVYLSAVIVGMSLFCVSGWAEYSVGGDDFESYPPGTWSASNAPVANPSTWYNGDNSSAINSTIELNGESNNVLRLDVDLQNTWQAGLTFELSCTNNQSQSMDDYSISFYLRVPSASVNNLTASGFYVNLRDPNDGSVGATYDISGYDPGYTHALSGALITIPLGTGIQESWAEDPMDGSLSKWEVEFRFDGNYLSVSQPISLIIDDLDVIYTPPPFLNPIYSPVGLSSTNPTISVILNDGTKEIDYMMLYWGDEFQKLQFFDRGQTNKTINYDWEAAEGGMQTWSVIIAAFDDGFEQTNHWTFQVPSPPPAPATNILQLFSFNIEGSNPGNASLNTLDRHTVSNGTPGVAPSKELNYWNNLMFENAWFIFNPWNWTLTEASGDTNTVCWFRINSDNAVGAYINAPWSWDDQVNNFLTFTPTESTMWPVWMGNDVTSLDLYFDGLDSGATYDLYMYFTSPASENTDETTYALKKGYAPMPVATLVSSWQPLMYGSATNYVEGENYAVITQVSPTSEGQIVLNVSGNNKAGIAAMQIAKRDDGESVIDPNIRSIEYADGMVILLWDSESGVAYSVLNKSELGASSWNVLTNDISGAGDSTSTTVPATSSAGFYMIKGE